MSDTMGLPPEPKGRGLGAALVILALIVVAGLVARKLGIFGSETAPGMAAGAPGEMPPMPVDVAIARADVVTDAVRATGRIEALQAIELKPEQQGRIVELQFQEGQVVAAGTALIRIDDAILRAQAERASADRDLAQQQLERVRRLRADNAASPADLERAEAAARSTDASLNLLNLQIERATVRAPFSGVVGQRFVSVGDWIDPGTRLLTLQTVDPQRAVIEVPERYAQSLQTRQIVQFTVAAYPGRTFDGTVEFIDPVVQNTTRTIVVKARVPNRERLLRPGMFIEARLATATRENAVVIPEDAIMPLRTGNVVWAVVDGKASRREVQLGARSAGFVEVVSGVQAGEAVVVGGLERMGEGMPIAPRPTGGAAAPGAAPGAGAAPGDSATTPAATPAAPTGPGL
jgi:membrane fusion protein (multidrug efflux system)